MMREIKFYCVVCDGCGRDAIESCEDIDSVSDLSAANQAERQGWNTTLLRGGDDLCPQCVMERYREYDRNERERRAARQEG